MSKSETGRNGWALTLSLTFSIFIFISFAFYKGFLSFGNGYTAPEQQVATVVSSDQAPSPMQNTKETLEAGLIEIGKRYQELKSSLLDVLVPFITGIEVYERK